MQNQNTAAKKKKKGSRQSSFLSQFRIFRSDDLDHRKLKPGSQQQWRERMREAKSKS